MPTTYQDVGVGDISADARAGGAGLAAALAGRARRRIRAADRQSETMATARRAEIAAGHEELRKAKKSAIAGDLASLAGFILPLAAGPLFGSAAHAASAGVGAAGLGAALPSAAALANYAVPISRAAGSIFGDPSPEVTGVVGLAGEIAQRTAVERRAARQKRRTMGLIDEPRGGTFGDPWAGRMTFPGRIQ